MLEFLRPFEWNVRVIDTTWVRWVIFIRAYCDMWCNIAEERLWFERQWSVFVFNFQVTLDHLWTSY